MQFDASKLCTWSSFAEAMANIPNGFLAARIRRKPEDAPRLYLRWIGGRATCTECGVYFLQTIDGETLLGWVLPRVGKLQDAADAPPFITVRRGLIYCSDVCADAQEVEMALIQGDS